MPYFDSYVMVDWSSNNRPVAGPNSVWICTGERQGNALNPNHLRTCNPDTRCKALDCVRAFLHQQGRATRRTLVGFDFPYGYPSGFAVALGLGAEGQQPWRQTWQRLFDDLSDRPDNHNNRFQVAAQFNEIIGQPPGPFWGHHPAALDNLGLPGHRPPFPFTAGNGVVLAEFRKTEQILRVAGFHPQSAWHLLGAGAVGGQVLAGIPTIKELRDDLHLRNDSVVWPFEAVDWLANRRPLVVHVEVWPRVVPGPTPAGVADEQQVLGLVAYFAQLDSDDLLLPLFEVPSQLPPDVRQWVLEEEGWTLGALYHEEV